AGGNRTPELGRAVPALAHVGRVAGAGAVAAVDGWPHMRGVARGHALVDAGPRALGTVPDRLHHRALEGEVGAPERQPLVVTMPLGRHSRIATMPGQPELAELPADRGGRLAQGWWDVLGLESAAEGRDQSRHLAPGPDVGGHGDLLLVDFGEAAPGAKRCGRPRWGGAIGAGRVRGAGKRAARNLTGTVGTTTR